MQLDVAEPRHLGQVSCPFVSQSGPWQHKFLEPRWEESGAEFTVMHVTVEDIQLLEELKWEGRQAGTHFTLVTIEDETPQGWTRLSQCWEQGRRSLTLDGNKVGWLVGKG